MPRRTYVALAAAGLLAAPSVMAQSSGAEQYCYLVADNNGVRFDADALTAVNKTTGVEIEVGLTGTLNIEAVAFHPFSPGIYAADGGLLGNIDVATGRFSPIGWLGTAFGDGGPLSAGDVDGMTFDPSSGELFGSVRKTEEDILVQIDPNTGRVVENAFGSGRSYVRITFGSDPINVEDIAVSPLSGNLFAIVTDASENSTLVTVNRLTGKATSMVDLGGEDLEGLTFDPDGRLYATPGGDGPDMVEIDLATGAVLAFAPIGVSGNRDYEAVTCMAYGRAGVTSTEGDGELPIEIELLPAYPNPFNPSTTFAFALPEATNIRLSVFDMLGREIELVADGFWTAGTHNVPFSAGDLPSGLYIYRLEAPSFVATRTVTLLR